MAKKKQTPQSPSVVIWALVIGIVLSVGAGALFLSQQRTAATSVVVKHDTMPDHTPPQPDWLLNAMQPVREAYYFAARNPDKLQYIPCYCGCTHASNAECYFQWDNQRNITGYEQHAYG